MEGKMQSLALGKRKTTNQTKNQTTNLQQYKLKTEQLGSSSAGRDLRQQAEYQPPVCPGSKECRQPPGLHKQDHSQ